MQVPELEEISTPSKRKWSIKRWLIGAVVLLVGIILYAVLTSLVDVSDLKTKNPGETSFMRYREQQAAEKKRKPLRRQSWIPLSAVSPALVQAVLISEDDKFFQHEGFDWDGIKTAVEKNIERKRFSVGGSTITQQLAKNLFLTPSKNPIRKLREAVLAYQMEKVLSKRRILELYLNVIEWGNGLYGVGAASQFYYSKSAADLSPSEAIRLASVLPNPIRYLPTRDNSRYMQKKRAQIAEVMFQRKLIDEMMYRMLQNEFGGVTP